MTEAKDGCPAWAVELITQIRDMEIALGNIPDTENWQTVDMEKFTQRSPIDHADAEAVDALFGKVARGLFSEDFTHDEIASFINARVFYRGGPKYCSAREVADILSPDA